MSAKFDEFGQKIYETVAEAKEAFLKVLDISSGYAHEFGKSDEEITESFNKTCIIEANTCKGTNGRLWQQAAREICAERGLVWETKPEPSPALKAFFKKREIPIGKKPCSKCGGSGNFCLYIENGTPKSNTGYDCYACGGKGYK